MLQSVAVRFIATIPPGPERDLFRYKLIAGACLALAAAFWTSSHLLSLNPNVIGYLRAAAEAGMVGGLADWFAVTALFRRPFGLPIPHTNLIAENQARIADGVAYYIESEFLQRETMVAQLRRVDITERIVGSLEHPANRERIVDGLMKFIPRALEGGRDSVIVDAILSGLRHGLADVDLRPALAQLTRGVVTSDDLLPLLKSLCQSGRSWLEANRSMILERVEKGSPRYVPKFVDQRIAGGLISAGIEILEAVQDPNTNEGKEFRKWLASLPTQIEYSQLVGNGAFDMLRKFLLGREVENIIRTTWVDIKKMINSDVNADASHIRAALSTFLESISSDFLDSISLRNRINAAFEAFVVENITGWRTEIRTFICQTLTQQEPRVFARRLELMVGKDVQYIRINGTIIGALIGVALYWANSVLSLP